VADFNSDLAPVIAPQGENAEILKWRRGRDSNPRRANHRNASLSVVYVVDE
jgi:hypothetical protein